VTDNTVLGDGANVAARLTSQVRAGEILMSAATFTSARLPEYGLESRLLALKGKSEPLEVWSQHVTPG
jgi:class 3 adenylate cyclase